ncbi:unnamed protein product [Gongylonema pulchrum]|uniref:Intraflagellar transport protein 122 homolog n=1 Tax=Gongylonema pulchrum TaxID=637853 RepID=A0A183CUY0_9BILA|nr:unnamed protein product [Gongylonema pulchrum]
MLASQLFHSINDIRSLVNMHVNAEHWNDAFAIASRYPKYTEEVYLPYARWLAESDRFDEAQKAYHLAGHDVEALWVLEQLTENAIRENRFLDAGYYHWMLSIQYLERSSTNPQFLEKFSECSKKADCYYAFDVIHKYLAEPFTSSPAEALVNIARYLAFQEEIYKISRVSILYTLLKQGQTLGAYKLARYSLEQLSHLNVPLRFEKLIESAALMIRSKPFTDADDLLPMCYRCGMSNPLVGGNECIHCKTPFILSFMNLKTGKIVANRETLLNLDRRQVIVAEWPPPLFTRFYYNIIPEISISQCSSCHHMFHADDFEMACLKTGACPFCHVVQQKRTDFDINDEGDLE